MKHSETPGFWDRRHQQLGNLTSGGDRGLSEPDNQAFYYTRLGTLLSIIGPASDEYLSLEILDAGCGRGFFSERLSRCGHNVVGFDPSPSALESIPEPRLAIYQESTVESFTWPHLFDVTYAIDVLFHILDNDAWARSLRVLASMTRSPGQLIVTDHNTMERLELGGYIVHRATKDYENVLHPLGFRRTNVLPYEMPHNPNAFHVFESVG